MSNIAQDPSGSPLQLPSGLAYTILLRPSFYAQLVIPKNLTTGEADRLNAFLQALAVPSGEPKE